MSTRYFGASVSRREDPRLLRGKARYVDDIKLPGLLHAAIVRSPHAHARLQSIQVEAARALPGVAGVFRFEDLAAWMQPMPTFGIAPPPLDSRIGLSTHDTPRYPLARDTVRYVGEQSQGLCENILPPLRAFHFCLRPAHLCLSAPAGALP